MRLTWLGHATATLDIDGVRIVTDPVLRRTAGPLRRGPAPHPDHWVGTDAVLMSHLHHDHADLPSLRMLAGSPVLTGAENGAYLRRQGVEVVTLDEGWVPVGTGRVEVRLVPAVHHSRPMPHRPNAAHGHLVRGPSGTVWVAGDTSLHVDLEHILDLAAGTIDVAVVPAGGWGPRLSGGHLDAVGAARAVRAVGASVGVPYHWGTLYFPGTTRYRRGWMDRPGLEFPHAMAAHAPQATALVIEPGTPVDL